MVPVRGVCRFGPLSSAPVGVSLLSGFPILQVWVPPGSRAKVGEAPVCVRVPRPPARPRRRRCASDTPASLGGPDGPSARGHARYLPPGPFVSVPILPGPGVDAPAAWVPPPPWCHSRSLGLPPSPALMSAPLLGVLAPPRLGVTAPLLGCSPPNPPPRARGRAACSRDPPPCSSSRAGVRPRVSPRSWVLTSACSPGCGFSF